METSFQKYLEFTRTTVIYPQDELLKFAYLANGLASEFGEALIAVQDLAISSVYTEQSRILLQSELGDILWYLTRILDELGCTPSDLLSDIDESINPELFDSESFTLRELALALVNEHLNPPDPHLYKYYLLTEFMIHIGDVCGIIKKMIRDRIPLPDVAKRVLPSLVLLFQDLIITISFHGFNHQTILEYNANKLSSRKQRSQLQGSGDFR